MRSDISLLLQQAGDGDATAMDRLIPLIYQELRAMAHAKMSREKRGHSLRPTELVGEAYLRLVGGGGGGGFENRAHFFAAAATAMRRVLIDHARARVAEKRGGADAQAVTFEDLSVEAEEPGVDVLELNAALEALEAEDPRLASVVQLRFFVGLTIEETAEAIGSSAATVKRDWTYARAWLHDWMQAD